MSRIRERSSNNRVYHLGWRGIYPDTIGTRSTYRAPMRERCIDEVHKGPPYRTGGGLDLRRVVHDRKPTASRPIWNGTRWYVGSFISNYWGNAPLDSSLSFSNPAIYLPNHGSDGATGWARFKPGQPGAQVGQFIGELRQLPNIPLLRRSARFFRDLGSEYLNVVFGWIPFLGEIRRTLRVTDELASRLAQLKRDNGRWIRREGTIATDSSSSTSVQTEFGYPILTGGFYQSSTAPGVRIFRQTDEVRRWFSAAFRYWIPDIDTPEAERRLIRRLYGLHLTPSLLWELMPWSWLIDWWSNMGDIMSNISTNAAENLVAKYAFNMSEFTRTLYVESELYMRGAESRGGPVHPFTLRLEERRTYTLKLRAAANPYGFGLDYDALSGRQWLILGALGLSRFA